MSHDLILKGARVIDPSQRHDGVVDVAFTDGKVSGFGADLRGQTVGLHAQLEMALEMVTQQRSSGTPPLPRLRRRPPPAATTAS